MKSMIEIIHIYFFVFLFWGGGQNIFIQYQNFRNECWKIAWKLLSTEVRQGGRKPCSLNDLHRGHVNKKVYFRIFSFCDSGIHTL